MLVTANTEALSIWRASYRTYNTSFEVVAGAFDLGRGFRPHDRICVLNTEERRFTTEYLRPMAEGKKT